MLKSKSLLKVVAVSLIVCAVGLGVLLAPGFRSAIIALVGVGAGVGAVLLLTGKSGLVRTEKQLEGLIELATSVSTSRSFRTVILQALETAVNQIKGTAGYIMLVDEDGALVSEAAYGVEGEFPFPDRIEAGQGISGHVAKMAQPIELTDNDKNVECDGLDVPVKSVLSVPLLNRHFTGSGQAYKEEVLGAMTILKTTKSEHLSSDDLRFIMSTASIASAAIATAKLEERHRATFVQTLESLATALEARDEYTQGHSQRVCDLSLMIAQKLGFAPDALEELRIGTILHDIGKIGVPDAILNKPSRLTEEEFHLMKQHPVIGYEICGPLRLSEGVLMIIRNHHEKLDGSGYPDGLKGGELPLSLRVVCIADAFDAMSSRRPYRQVMEIGKVIAELSRGAGVQFDPVIVEILRNLLESGGLEDLYRTQWETNTDVAA